MSKLSRIFQNIFGRDGNQSHYGQFGSRAAAAPFLTKDPSAIQALSAFLNNGWKDAINSGNKAAFLEDMNGLFYLVFYQLAYGFQEGIPEWDGSTPYFLGSIVKKTGTFELYGSLTNTNVGNALPAQTDNGFWKYLNPQSVPAGQVSAFAGASAPVGYLIADGTAYAQASQPALFAAIGSAWNTYRGLSAPAAGQFRVPALQGLTLIGVGSGLNGLTPRSLADFVGEEAHILTASEMPTHAHGVNDPGHHHSERVSNTPSGALGVQSATGINSILDTTLTTGDATTGVTIQNTGGNGSHNNMQPSGALNYIIKT